MLIPENHVFLIGFSPEFVATTKNVYLLYSYFFWTLKMVTFDVVIYCHPLIVA
jgi:hypothetical protein